MVQLKLNRPLFAEARLDNAYNLKGLTAECVLQVVPVVDELVEVIPVTQQPLLRLLLANMRTLKNSFFDLRPR